ADRLVKRVALLDRAEELAVAHAEALHRRLVQQHLAHRLELEAVEAAGGALAKRVEAGDALHLVAEEIEANGLGGARRKDVDDAAPERIFARLAHRFRAPVAVQRHEAA